MYGCDFYNKLKFLDIMYIPNSIVIKKIKKLKHAYSFFLLLGYFNYFTVY